MIDVNFDELEEACPACDGPATGTKPVCGICRGAGVILTQQGEDFLENFSRLSDFLDKHMRRYRDAWLPDA